MENKHIIIITTDELIDILAEFFNDTTKATLKFKNLQVIHPDSDTYFNVTINIEIE